MDCLSQVWEGRLRFQGLRVHTDSHLTGFKTMMKSLPKSPLILPKPALIWLTVKIIEAPQRDLDPTPLTFGERFGVILQDPKAIPPVLLAEVIPEAVPGPRWSWAPRKGRGTGMRPFVNYLQRPVGCALSDWMVTSPSWYPDPSQVCDICAPSYIPLWVLYHSPERGYAAWVAICTPPPPCPCIVVPPLLPTY